MLKKTISSMLILFVFFPIATVQSMGQECGDIDCSGGEPDISDITRLIDYLYLSHDPLCDPLLADVNNSGGEPDISDITRLIDFLYISHNPLNCPTGSDCPATVTDIDGNVYQVVEIGDQCWMAENLKVTHYRNSETVPNVIDDWIWFELSTGAYCNYDNNGGNVSTYGRLYNWYAVMDSRGLAPEGWHVPSDEEWKQLEMYLGMSQAAADSTGLRGVDEGGKLKESGTVHWNAPNTGATNESGFTALPGGYRDQDGRFFDMGSTTFFWASTVYDIYFAWLRNMGYNSSKIARSWNFKRGGLSVRCVKDQ